MNLEEANQENLSFIINEMAERLQVVNRSIMDPDDYNLDNYDELKSLYQMIEQKGSLSVSETQAFIEELKNYRK
ncbi:DUF1128 domain-containing protein [Saliterribacillus persicus]|uniref:Uncharacterized protein YfkK (UPF0435 family) n=1 Tax=Saliterribacillus persicus TaxID=930114 RepID=A0A368XW52_9BACI|nr:DUF1128 domain-containing protein [Saliterribacillus persicus]RCW70747.1 uncharacterized protein YfkK (UPF0435 family) [Saliterribacillus persicus]